MVAGLGKANVIFNLVFFILVTSILIQGTTLALLAKWLKLAVPVNIKKKSVLDLEMGWKTKSLYNIVPIETGFSCTGKTIVDLGLPNSIVIALVQRNNKFFVSEGSTILHSGDKLYIMADDERSMEKLYDC